VMESFRDLSQGPRGGGCLLSSGCAVRMSRIVNLVCVSTSAAGFGFQALSAINQTRRSLLIPRQSRQSSRPVGGGLRDEALQSGTWGPDVTPGEGEVGLSNPSATTMTDRQTDGIMAPKFRTWEPLASCNDIPVGCRSRVFWLEWVVGGDTRSIVQQESWDGR